MSENEIIISVDEQGVNRISNIEWDTKFITTLIDGTKHEIENGAQAGQTVSSSFFLVNKTPNRFGITELKCSDGRIRTQYNSAWVLGFGHIKVTLSYTIPSNPTKYDVIKNAKFILKGYFVIEG